MIVAARNHHAILLIRISAARAIDDARANSAA
jgi:hypothetical protein